MEPIPPTRQAISALQRQGRDTDLLEELREKADRVVQVVPDCVGISIGYLREGLTLTLVATEEEFAVLDALQYLGGGPCVEAVRGERVLETDSDDVLDEDAWLLFARRSAARAIASTLTLPVLDEGRVVGSVNLYGASGRAFTGRHQEVARIFGAWAPGAVANADLSFSTLADAEEAPRRLGERQLIDEATGIIADNQGIELSIARLRLISAARRAGLTEAELARVVVESTRH